MTKFSCSQKTRSFFLTSWKLWWPPTQLELNIFCWNIANVINVRMSIKRSEAVVRRCYVKKLFLEISENSQENTCARVSFSIHFLWGILYYLITDTHRKKSPLNKIPRCTKSMNMDIWVVVASKQLFIRGS